MNRLCVVLFIVFLYTMGYWCAVPSNFRQEGAKLKYFNPKYIKDVVVLTARKSRNDPYLTNMTATILKPYGNNVSVLIYLTLLSGGTFRLTSRICDTMKTSAKWMFEFHKRFTNMTLKCPVPLGRYSYYNMELPPKNAPIPLSNGDYQIGYELYMTATKERIMECYTRLHFDSNNGKKG